MTTLYLVRHGETVDNANRIMQGQTQGELTANGREQAREVALKMASAHIDAFVSSDLKRSYDTCSIIAEPHGAIVTTTPLLRERDWGGFTGRYIPDLKDEPWPDDIESLEALRRAPPSSLTTSGRNSPLRLCLPWGMASSTRQCSRYSTTSRCRKSSRWLTPKCVCLSWCDALHRALTTRGRRAMTAAPPSLHRQSMYWGLCVACLPASAEVSSAASSTAFRRAAA